MEWGARRQGLVELGGVGWVVICSGLFAGAAGSKHVVLLFLRCDRAYSTCHVLVCPQTLGPESTANAIAAAVQQGGRAPGEEQQLGEWVGRVGELGEWGGRGSRWVFGWGGAEGEWAGWVGQQVGGWVGWDRRWVRWAGSGSRWVGWAGWGSGWGRRWVSGWGVRAARWAGGAKCHECCCYVAALLQGHCPNVLAQVSCCDTDRLLQCD